MNITSKNGKLKIAGQIATDSINNVILTSADAEPLKYADYKMVISYADTDLVSTTVPDASGTVQFSANTVSTDVTDLCDYLGYPNRIIVSVTIFADEEVVGYNDDVKMVVKQI